MFYMKDVKRGSRLSLISDYGINCIVDQYNHDFYHRQDVNQWKVIAWKDLTY